VNKLLVIAGPTASGKSALASSLAERFGGVVINADSMQVYRGVPILTAQPTEAEQARLPHRLYGQFAPDQLCSAGIWRALAVQACEAAWKEGTVPVVVGGTGLYLRALVDGLSPIPDIPAEVRDASRMLFAELGKARFYEKLAQRDPVMAQRLDPGNSQRLVRAWEVIEATGRSLAEWQADPRQGGLDADSATLLLTPPREALYANCDRRLTGMLAAGALDEVAALMELGLDPALPVMKALGVAEFAAHLRGALSLTEALALAQQSTRRYAKRQLTWFRHQLIPRMTIEEKLSESLLEKIYVFIRPFLLTAAS
jgi:tRNA dimethylallyltransferase